MRNKTVSTGGIKSDFNREENFDINSIPEHFDSIKSTSLDKLKQSIIENTIDNTMQKPSALQMALKGVDGQFEEAYSVLEGDYSARKTKLQSVYTQSISDIRKAFTAFELQVEEHNIAFRNYSNANKILYGDYLSDKLAVSQEEMNKLKKAIESL